MSTPYFYIDGEWTPAQMTPALTQTVLNCPNCGAPITGSKCEYCGSTFTISKVDERYDLRTQLNMASLEAAQTLQTEFLYANNKIMESVTKYE